MLKYDPPHIFKMTALARAQCSGYGSQAAYVAPWFADCNVGQNFHNNPALNKCNDGGVNTTIAGTVCEANGNIAAHGKQCTPNGAVPGGDYVGAVCVGNGNGPA
jgi:hypothetical protein